MKPGFVLLVALSAGLTGFAAGCRATTAFDATRRAGLAEEIVAGWPAPSRLAADAMLEKYGRSGPCARAGGGREQTAAYRGPVDARR